MLYGGKYYCAECQERIDDARKSVCPLIDPRECFVEFRGGDTWGKIVGTGCAHWVAHEINRTGGSDECLLGHTIRIPDLIAGLSKRSSDHGRRNISVGDIYVTANHGHCGLVVSVDENTEQGGKPKIVIRNDSSTSTCEGRGVVDDDFDHHFHGKGEFYW